MSTAVSSSNPSRVPAPQQRLLLDDCNWTVYSRMLETLEGRHVRVTYDQGAMEIMTVSAWHELCKRLLANMVDVVIEARELDACPVGNTTWRDRAAGRGLEPDDGWYIAHAGQMKGKTKFDLATDPPPDLMLEIEVSQSALDRMTIYAQLRVPEVWRCDGKSVRFERLEGGRYVTTEESIALPGVRAAELNPFIVMRAAELHTTVMRAFRQWLRDRGA